MMSWILMGRKRCDVSKVCRQNSLEKEKTALSFGFGETSTPCSSAGMLCSSRAGGEAAWKTPSLQRATWPWRRAGTANWMWRKADMLLKWQMAKFHSNILTIEYQEFIWQPTDKLMKTFLCILVEIMTFWQVINIFYKAVEEFLTLWTHSVSFCLPFSMPAHAEWSMMGEYCRSKPLPDLFATEDKWRNVSLNPEQKP